MGESPSPPFDLEITFFDGIYLIKPTTQKWNYEDAEEILDVDESY